MSELKTVANESGLEYKIVGNKVIITGVNSDVINIEIPDEIDGKLVTGIADNAFSHMTALVSVKLGANIKTIGGEAFANSSIKEITIPNTVTDVEHQCFKNCRNLYSVKWNSDCAIPYECFMGCSSLKHFDFSKCKDIEGWAFSFSGIKEITISNNVKLIKEGVFFHCEMLEKVKWEAETSTIADNTFCGCKNLKKFNFGNIDVIGLYVFSESGLEEVDLSSNTKKVHSNAFSDCLNLKKVTWGCPCIIPCEAFASCSNLEDVCITSVNTFRYGNFISEDAFDECEKVQVRYGIDLVKILKERYPKGTKIYINSMNDNSNSVERGSIGEVLMVDDIGTLHCRFDNGRMLDVVPNVDSFRKIK